MTDSAPSLSPLIHLVDDDAAVREGLSLLIGTVGLRVQTWADPQSFMAGFDRASIGAIVLDVRMPGISGLTVLEQLLAQGPGRVSGSPRPASHRSAPQIGLTPAPMAAL